VEISEAKKLYESINSYQSQLLPLGIFEKVEGVAFEKDLLAIADWMTSLNISENNANKVHLDSPWHAALFLRATQHSGLHLSQNSEVNRIDEHRAEFNHHSRWLFRGQSNVNHKVLPQAFRDHAYESHIKKGRIFSMLLHDVLRRFFLLKFQEDEFKKLWISEVTKDALKKFIFSDLLLKKVTGIAQHYGQYTELLDFSFDPNISVFFANVNRGNNTPCVFFYPMHYFGNEKIEMHLPFPMFTRIYDQRGMFIKADREYYHKLNDYYNFITFTPRKNFQVIRKKEIIDVYADNKSMLAFIEKLNQLVNTCYDQKRSYTKEELALLGEEFYLVEEFTMDKIVEWGEAISIFEYYYARATAGNKETLALDDYEMIARHNAPILSFYNGLNLNYYSSLQEKTELDESRVREAKAKKEILDKF